MKKYIYLYAIAGIMILTGFICYLNILKNITNPTIDYVAINELTKQVAHNFHDLEQLKKTNFTYRFVIMDNAGDILYSSDENLPDNVPALIKNSFIPMDITTNTGVSNKIFIDVSQDNGVKQAKSTLANITLISFTLLCVLNLIFLFALHKTLIKPFKRMEKFAYKISVGKFDEPLPMDKNNTFGLFTQSFDVMRESLLEARQKQLKAERAGKELIASLSHDVKTPVTSIRLITELLQVSNTDPDITEKLIKIESKTIQIDRLINDLLNSALEELGELKVNVTTEKSETLNNLFHNADPLSKLRIGEIPTCLIEFDVMRMEQIIGNIIANSYKYSETDIDVDCKLSGELLQIDISDYGTGVAPESLELIFTKFYRGENAKQSGKEGEGLGLYTAKLLIEKMDGSIEAFNRNDGFTIRIFVRLSR